MPTKCREVCAIQDLPACSTQRLVELWKQYASGQIESDDEWILAFMKQYFDRGLTPTIDLTKGRMSFDVSDEDMRLINLKSLDPWVRPDSSREDFSYILGYGQSFGGYEFAESRGMDLAEFGNKHLREYQSTGEWKGDFVGLRCCLFYELRRQHHIGLYENNWREIQSLFRAVRAAYDSEGSQSK